MGRCESLLAWLSSFGGPFEALHEDPEAWELLQDGRLLLSLLLCLDANACYTTEYEAYRLRTPDEAWKVLLPRLQCLPEPLSQKIGADEECSYEQVVQVLECFLGTTVSPTTAGQAQAIQQILSLNAEDQAELKAVIEEQMMAAMRGADESTQEGSGVQEVDTVIDSIEEVTEGTGAERMDQPVEGLTEGQEEGVTADRHSVDSEESEGCTPAKEDEDSSASATSSWSHYDSARLRHLEMENKQIRASEAAALERERQALAEVEEMRQSLLRRSLTGEVQVMELEEAYKQEMDVLKKKLTAAEKQSEQMEQHRQQLEKLQDEVDVLRPLREQLEVAEEGLARARDKIHNLQDVKEQLVEEQAAHADLLERSLKQERELQQLGPLKRQVETYKQSLTELEVDSRELQASLMEKDKEVAALKAELEGMQEVQAVSHARQEQLEKEMLATRAAPGGGGLSGIGEGLSECNPEVLEHIRTLEEKCAHLEAQVSDTAIDRLERLTTDLDDAKRLATNFEDKFRKTRSELQDMTARMEAQTKRAETAEEEVKVLSETLDLVEADAKQAAREAEERATMATQERDALTATIRELTATVEMSQVELDQRVYLHGRVSKCEFEKSKAAAWLSSLGSRTIIGQLQQRLEETVRSLDEARQRLEGEQATRQAAEMCVLLMKKDVEQKQQAAQEAVAQARAEGEARLRDLQQQAMAAIQEREVQYHQAVSRLSAEMADYKAQHVAVTNEQYGALQHNHAAAMQAKEQEVASLQLEVDELKMVQCRLEREKRFLRDETQALLAQERAAAGKGSRSVDTSDMEGLQAEFQTLLREHTTLRRQVRAAEEGIGFSLSDFEPQEDKTISSTRGRGPLEREFQVSATPGSDDSGSRARGRGLRSLKTPPERVPMPGHDDSSMKIEKLVDERRAMFLELTAAHAKTKKLETELASVETQMTKKDGQLTSLNLKVARLQRQLDMISEKGAYGEKENLPSNGAMRARSHGGGYV